MRVVFGLDDRDGDVRLVEEQVIGPAGLASGDELSPNDDPALGETVFLSDLRGIFPARSLNGWGDELGADIPF